MTDLTRRQAMAALGCLSFAAPALAQTTLPLGMRCSGGWFVTGYYTTSEAEYAGTPVEIVIDGRRHTFPAGFLRKVRTDGWGLTRHGWFLGWNKTWRRGDAPLTARGRPLALGSVAVDQKLVPLGTNIRIPDLPPPWNERLFLADDIGGGIVSKRLDVYCGCGADKRPETLRLTSHGHVVCLGGATV
jgi:3D (Asp-Asp-Asp) domain-containing protein